MKVEANREVCIGSGNCVMTEPEVFDQDDAAVVVVLTAEVPGDRVEQVRRAVANCPSGALRLVEG